MITINRRRVIGLGAVVLSLFLLAEIVARLVAANLPTPLEWSSDEAQVKFDDIRARLTDRPPAVVFVGSSIMDAAVDADAFARLEGTGRPGYNAALLGSPMDMIATWTTKVVVPTVRPSVVVVGVSCREVNGREPEQQAITEEFEASPALRRLLGTDTVLDRLDRDIGRFSYLVRYRSVFRQPRNLLGRDRRVGTRLAVSASGRNTAFDDLDYPPADRLTDVLRPGAITLFELGQDELRSLRDLVTDLRSQGIGVLVISMPITADFVAWMPYGRRDHDACVGAIKGVTESAGGLHRDAGIWERKLFADPIHVNRSGAERVTALAASAVRAMSRAGGG